MACQKCKSERVASASGKVSDMFHWSSGDYQHDGYVPEGLGVGGGDYFEVEYCLDCGQMQGKFPVTVAAVTEMQIEQLEKERDYAQRRLGDSNLRPDHRARYQEQYDDATAKLTELCGE